MLKAHYKKHTLHFKFKAGTSRGVMHQKTSYFLLIERDDACVSGIGECGLLQGLSPDDTSAYETKLQEVCHNINQYAGRPEALQHYPSIRFGLETALKDISAYRSRELYSSPFTTGHAGIPINGLIWMDSADNMQQQVDNKLKAGFTCLKLKIGAIDWEQELNLLKKIRNRYSAESLELRVDANGAFTPGEASARLDALQTLKIHSIEQPIKPGQPAQMAHLCKKHGLPVALDEELIGVYDSAHKMELLERLQPQYIILKPTLLGGIAATREWIEQAEKRGIGWWITSALESNIGLNALAQWTFTLKNPLPQGLGTGQLYTNNLPSPLEIKEGQLWHNPTKEWNLQALYKKSGP